MLISHHLPVLDGMVMVLQKISTKIIKQKYKKNPPKEVMVVQMIILNKMYWQTVLQMQHQMPLEMVYFN